MAVHHEKRDLEEEVCNTKDYRDFSMPSRKNAEFEFFNVLAVAA